MVYPAIKRRNGSAKIQGEKIVKFLSIYKNVERNTPPSQEEMNAMANGQKTQTSSSSQPSQTFGFTATTASLLQKSCPESSASLLPKTCSAMSFSVRLSGDK
jgi:hypothetical protein